MDKENIAEPHLSAELVELRARVKKLEAQLAASEEATYRLIIEHSPQAIAIFQDDHLVFVNPVFAEISGYTMEEALSFTPDQTRAIVYPDDRGLVFARTIEEIVVESSAPRFEFRFVRRDGEIRWAEQYTSLINYHGRPALQVSYNDITEQKRAEEALRQSEEKFRLLTEKSVTGVYIIQDGMLVYINPKGAAMLGYRPEEVIGRLTPFDLMHPDYHELLTRTMADRLDGKLLDSNTEYRLLRKDGSVVDAEIYGMLIDYRGRPAIMGTVIDVTELKQSAARLLISEQRFHSLFENAVDGIMVLDRDGRFIDCNVKSQEMLGYPKPAILGKTPWDFSPSLQPHGYDSRTLATRLVQSVFAGRPVLGRWKHLRADGAEFDVEVHLSTIEFDGKRAALAIMRDITERVRLERRLRQVQEAERSRLARELHDSVSQTLSSARITAEVLPRIWEQDPAEGQKRLQELIDLNRIAQQEMRSLLFELYPTALENNSITEVLQQLVSNMRRRTKTSLTFSSRGHGVIGLAEKLELYRISQEAINNAIKHARAANIRVSITFRKPRVHLRVADDGRGFVMSESLSKGFGIRSMRERARLIGASLRIRSLPAAGTVVSVRWENRTEG